MKRYPIDRPGGSVSDDRLRPRPLPEVDWPRWNRQIERKRRLLRVPERWPGWVYRESTRASFILEGIEVDPTDVDRALNAPKPLRSRHAGRLRNHLAILRSLDRARRQHRALALGEVVRWYTAVSSGLSTANLSPSGHDRLLAITRQIHSPQRRLQPAVLEAARLYTDLLADPLFPGFNGILSRLLLHAYLLNCGLPPVVFDANQEAEANPVAVTAKLLEMLDSSLDRLGARNGDAASPAN